MEISEILSISDLPLAQSKLAELIAPLKGEYFVVWQHIHPKLYIDWQTNPEDFNDQGLVAIEDMAGTYTPPLTDDLDLFWTTVITKINTEDKFPCIAKIPLEMWLKPIPEANLTPLHFIIDKIMDPRHCNLLLADLARTYNIDAAKIIYCPNQWSLELILRLRSTNNINISKKDRKGWLDQTLELYRSRKVRYNENVSPSWLAFYMVQFIETTLDNQAIFEIALRLILREATSLNDRAIDFVAKLLKEKWFAPPYNELLHTALEAYYSELNGRPMNVMIKSEASTSSSLSPKVSSSFDLAFKQNCPAWTHTEDRVIWVKSNCTCEDPTECLLKQHNLFTLDYCSCAEDSFCILRAIHNEIDRLNEVHTVLL